MGYISTPTALAGGEYRRGPREYSEYPRSTRCEYPEWPGLHLHAGPVARVPTSAPGLAARPTPAGVGDWASCQLGIGLSASAAKWERDRQARLRVPHAVPRRGDERRAAARLRAARLLVRHVGLGGCGSINSVRRRRSFANSWRAGGGGVSGEPSICRPLRSGQSVPV
jgi:hypothetical protein